MNELMLIRQMMGSSGWLDAVFLLALFGIVLFRRESIAIPGLFKLAYILFALSIAMPALTVPILGAIGGGQTTARMIGSRSNALQSDMGFALSLLVYGGGPTVFAFSVICAFASLMPRKIQSALPAQPVKHPLD